MLPFLLGSREKQVPPDITLWVRHCCILGLAWNDCDWFNEIQTRKSRTKMIMGAARPFSSADTALWSGCVKVLWINCWVELMEKWRKKNNNNMAPNLSQLGKCPHISVSDWGQAQLGDCEWVILFKCLAHGENHPWMEKWHLLKIFGIKMAFCWTPSSEFYLICK